VEQKEASKGLLPWVGERPLRRVVPVLPVKRGYSRLRREPPSPLYSPWVEQKVLKVDKCAQLPLNPGISGMLRKELYPGSWAQGWERETNSEG